MQRAGRYPLGVWVRAAELSTGLVGSGVASWCFRGHLRCHPCYVLVVSWYGCDWWEKSATLVSGATYIVQLVCPVEHIPLEYARLLAGHGWCHARAKEGLGACIGVVYLMIRGVWCFPKGRVACFQVAMEEVVGGAGSDATERLCRRELHARLHAPVAPHGARATTGGAI